MHFKDLRFQQTVLCIELMIGFAGYFFLSWLLRARGYVQNPQNMADLNRVAIQLFVPYLGIAIGGIFGVTKLGKREVDPYTFAIAALTTLLWDLLALGNLALVGFGAQAVEDVVQFSQNTMPVVSTMLAASIAYYFGAQTKPAGANKADFAARQR
jgi:hypothetical protein